MAANPIGGDVPLLSDSNNNPSQFLKVYFDFGYHMFLHPFRFKYEKAEYVLKYSLPHQVFHSILCVVINNNNT